MDNIIILSSILIGVILLNLIERDHRFIFIEHMRILSSVFYVLALVFLILGRLL